MAGRDRRGYPDPQLGIRWLILACLGALVASPPAGAAGWLPHDIDAE
jgi:hypothetical protein